MQRTRDRNEAQPSPETRVAILTPKPSSQNLLMGFTVFFQVLIIIREPHICIPNGPFSKVCWHFSRFWIAVNASLNLVRCPQISLYGSQHTDCLLYSQFLFFISLGTYLNYTLKKLKTQKSDDSENEHLVGCPRMGQNLNYICGLRQESKVSFHVS